MIVLLCNSKHVMSNVWRVTDAVSFRSLLSLFRSDDNIHGALGTACIKEILTRSVCA